MNSTSRRRKQNKGLRIRERLDLWSRFGFEVVVPCEWCGKYLAFPEMTVDHEPPLAEGGGYFCIVPACKSCNEQRNAKQVKRSVRRAYRLRRANRSN